MYTCIPNASIVVVTRSTEWGDWCSGGDGASDQESGGKGRQLATSALKNHDKIHEGTLLASVALCISTKVQMFVKMFIQSVLEFSDIRQNYNNTTTIKVVKMTNL